MEEETKKTRIQRLLEEEDTEDETNIYEEEYKPTRIEQIYEGRAPKTIDYYTKSPKVYISTLEYIDFSIQRSGGKQRGKGKHTF